MGLNISDRGYMYLSWDAMGDDTTGDNAQVGNYADKTVQFAGTWGGATAVLEGSMDGATWFTLTDYQGAAISVTANAMKAISENPRFIRPVTSGGSGTDVDVIIGGRA